MKLFIAVNFPDHIKSALLEGISNLKDRAVSGNFTRPENLHLTLVFIGETTNVSAVRNVIDSINSKAFDITIGGLGKFVRNGGSIYWAGIKSSEELKKIAEDLAYKLKKSGFSIENKEFRPHITLGREVKTAGDIGFEINEVKMEVNRISLMKSERIKGVLTYTEIYGKPLI